MPFAWAAGITAGAGLIGGAMQSSAAGSANKASIAAQQAAEEQARADLQPWVTAGQPALTATSDLLGLNGPDAATAAMGRFQTSPGYQFQLSEGLRGVDAGAAAKGMLRSGATLKAEETFGQGLANKDFGDYYNRLFQLSSVGETAAAKQGAFSSNAADSISKSDALLGQQQASIYGNTASGIGTAANNYAKNTLYDDRTKAIAGGGGDTTPTVYQANGFMGNYGVNNNAAFYG
jgi:hypothetical protein